MAYSRGQLQFELDLFPGIPWQGRSPRVLTKGRKSLSLRREPLFHEVNLDSMQLELFGSPNGYTERGPFRIGRAPSLFRQLELEL